MNPERGDRDLERESNRDLGKEDRETRGEGQRDRVTWKARHNRGAEDRNGDLS